MTAGDEVRLAELLCARLCHDLAGPVGAAAAGAELFEDMDGEVADAETLGLVAASAAGAAARLKLFRTAFGPAAGAPLPAASLRDLIDSHLRTAVSAASTGTLLDWRTEMASLDGELARLAINLVLVAKDALPRGGVITIAGDESRLAVSARGEAVSMADDVRDGLISGAPPSGPRGAQALFTRIIAHARRLSVRVSLADGELVLAAAPASPDRGKQGDL